MKNFVTTNIRLPDTDYHRLKKEAVMAGKSLAAVIRNKLHVQVQKQSPQALINQIRKHAKENTKALANTDAVTIIRAIRKSP